MAISNATRLSDFGSGIGTAGAVLEVDNTNQRIGIGTDTPQGMLQVGTAITMGGNTGIISAVTYNADSGVNVGSAVTIVGATGVVSATTYYGENINAGAGVTIVGATGVVSATTYYGALTGNVTGDVSGSSGSCSGNAATATLATNAQGLTGTPDVTVNNVIAGFGTFSGNISAVDATLSGTLTYDDVTNVDAVGYATFRSGTNVQGAGSTTTTLNVSGVSTLGVTSVTDFTASGTLVEAFSSTTTAYSSSGDLNITNGNLQFCSANLGGTNNTLNIMSTTGINTDLATGEALNVTAITAVNASTAYVNQITIDGIAVTETWVGGSAPTDGGRSGYDTYSFNILKTGSETFICIANQVKTS